MGKGSQSQTQKQEPWKAQQPYLKQGFEMAEQNLHGNLGPNYPDFPTYTPFTPWTSEALQQTWDRGMSGSPVNTAAQNWATNILRQPRGGAHNQLFQGVMGAPGGAQMQATARGDMLNANPYLDQMMQSAAEGVMPGINATFGGAGRTGSNAHAASLGKAQGQLAADIYGRNFMNERGLQQQAQQGIANIFGKTWDQTQAQQAQAARMAPMLAGADYTDLNALMQVGGQTQDQSNRILQDQINRFMVNTPDYRLQQYLPMIQGNYGMAGKTSSGSKAGGVLGGGMSGAMAGAQFGGPWGAVAGGILGGLSGLL